MSLAVRIILCVVFALGIALFFSARALAGRMPVKRQADFMTLFRIIGAAIAAACIVLAAVL